jgi:hypothetical protein
MLGRKDASECWEFGRSIHSMRPTMAPVRTGECVANCSGSHWHCKRSSYFGLKSKTISNRACTIRLRTAVRRKSVNDTATDPVDPGRPFHQDVGPRHHLDSEATDPVDPRRPFHLGPSCLSLGRARRPKEGTLARANRSRIALRVQDSATRSIRGG